MEKERFVRWQRYTTEQLTFALNLFLGLSVGSLAFGITLLREDTFLLVGCSKVIFSIGLVALAASVVIGCAAVVSRLLDFRYTAQKVRADEKGDSENESGVYQYRSKALGRLTWRLFWFELFTFSVGVVGLFVALYSKYGHKLW